MKKPIDITRWSKSLADLRSLGDWEQRYENWYYASVVTLQAHIDLENKLWAQQFEPEEAK